MSIRICCSLGLLLMIMSCTQDDHLLPDHINSLDNLTVHSPNQEPESSIRLVRDRVFDNSDRVVIGRPNSVAVDHSGRVFISDGQEMDIKVYEPDGRFLSRIGRRGTGPGEFSSLTNLQISGNRLFAHDPNQRRSLIFTLDSLAFDYSLDFTGFGDYEELLDVFPNRYQARSDHTLLMEFTRADPSEVMSHDRHTAEYRGLYYLLDERGQVNVGKLFEMKSFVSVLFSVGERRVGTPVDFYGKSLISISGDDRIFAALTDDFLIKLYDSDGIYKRAFYHPYEKVPLSPETAPDDETADLIQRGIRADDIPEEWPALNDMIVDDENRLWISTVVEDPEVYNWWVLQETGEVIASFEWPREKSIERVKDGYLYTMERDEMDIISIIRYRIEMQDDDAGQIISGIGESGDLLIK